MQTPNGLKIDTSGVYFLDFLVTFVPGFIFYLPNLATKLLANMCLTKQIFFISNSFFNACLRKIDIYKKNTQPNLNQRYILLEMVYHFFWNIDFRWKVSFSKLEVAKVHLLN